MSNFDPYTVHDQGIDIKTDIELEFHIKAFKYAWLGNCGKDREVVVLSEYFCSLNLKFRRNT